MSDCVRVLTYNVQFRSRGLEILAQQNPFAHVSVEQRAQVVAARILASPQQYDVVCLQEVFHEKGRDILVDRLGAAYPHRIEKCDSEGLSFTAGASLGALAFSATIPGGILAMIGSGILSGISLNALPLDLEDSGLMLFSRIPFRLVDTTQAIQDQATGLGVLFPVKVPAIASEVYVDSAGVDAASAKGVLYAGFQREDGRPFHVLTSHTQADDTGAAGAHLGTRRSQLEQAYALLERTVPDLDAAEVLFCGDLNVDGMFRDDDGGYGLEYRLMFDAPGTHYTDQLVDGWAREQSPGEKGPGRTVLPDFFDRGITAQVQRLDYALRGRGPREGRLALQHMPIAYEIANDPARPTFYTSDHLPVRIDLAPERPHCTVLTAEPVPVTLQAPDADLAGFLLPGQTHWYRIDEAGGYRIGLVEGGPHAQLDVYTADNLSVPVRPFTTLDTPGGPTRETATRWALPSAPFYLRVSAADRGREGPYRLLVHRFTGTGPTEAIPLAHNVPRTFRPRTGAPHSTDDPTTTAWSEHDAVWFTAPLDTEPDGRMVVTSTVTVLDPATSAFGALVLVREGTSGPLEARAEEGPDAAVRATFNYALPATGYFLVRREDPTFQAPEFTVELTSNISYLYGDPGNPTSRAKAMARLFCRDETNTAFGTEIGSDDIGINVIVGGETVVHIENGDELEFDDDSLHDFTTVDGVRYTGTATFQLREVDDTSADDRASVEIPQFADLAGDDRVISGDPSTKLVKFTVIFDPADDEDDDDDGIYDLTITVSSQPPTILTP